MDNKSKVFKIKITNRAIYLCLLKFIFFSLFLSSCILHEVKEDYELALDPEDSFSILGKEKKDDEEYWYEHFKDPALNRLMRKALDNNLTVKEAWSRLMQAELNVKIAGAALYPQVNAGGDITGQDYNGLDNKLGYLSGWDDRKSFSLNLNWELDLWGKIRADKASKTADFKAAYSDLHYTALLISSIVAKSYFDFKEQKAILELVRKQVEKDKQFYELIKLRKSTGRVTVLDVQRQKQQLLSSMYKIPEIEMNIEIIKHNIAVLCGLSSSSYEYSVSEDITDVPEMPYIGTPKDLLKNNRQIMASYQRLKAADYNIAVQMAQRLPSVSFNSFYKIGNPVSGGSSGTIYSVVASVIQNIFDAGRLANQYEYSKETYNEKLYNFKKTYLDVIKSVEDAISKENYRKKKFNILKEQVELARSNLKESNYQYSYGLIEYINVLEAFVRLYTLEEQFFMLKRDIIDARIDLNLALGGIVLDKNKITGSFTDD